MVKVISRAYERLNPIVTTNLTFAEWTEVFSSECLTGALLDRVPHRVHILGANGESNRRKEGKTHQKRSWNATKKKS